LKPFHHLTTIGLTTILVASPYNWVSALPAPTISQIAKKITVKITAIDSEGNAAYGSGVIIKRQGGTYTLLSARHVLSKSLRNYKVKTSDNQEYAIDPQKIRVFAKNIDLAVVEFNSSATYPVVELGSSSTIVEGSSIFVAGFPAPTQTIESPAYMFRKGDVVANSSSGLNRDGYGMIYTANTLPGMSGGGVFDENGKLVAIHGQGDVDSKFVGDSSNPNVRFKTGNDLGIPIDTYIANAASVAIDTGRSAPALPTAPPKAGDFYVSAANKKEKEDYVGAITDYTKAIQLDPKFAKAYNERGLAYQILKQNKNALADFDRAIQIKPDFAEAYSNRSIFYQNSNLPKAIADAKQLVALKPQDPQSYYLLSVYYFSSKDLSNAIATLRQGEKNVTAEERITVSFWKMLYLSSTKNSPEVTKTAREIIQFKNSTIVVKGLAIYFLLLNGQTDDATQELDKLIVEKPKDALPQWLRGLSIVASPLNDNLSSQDRLLVAAPYFEKAILADPSSDIGYSARQIVKQISGNLSGALADANKALKLRPNQPLLYHNRGVAYWEIGNFRAALADFNQAIKLQSPILAKSKNDSDEIKRNKIFHYYRGATYERLKNYQQALSDYEFAVQENGAKDDLTGVSMGMVAKFNVKSQARSDVVYNLTGISNNMQFYSILASRGRVKLLLGDKKGGLADLDLAVKVKAGPSAYYQRALTRRDAGDKAGAIADLKVALEKAKEYKFAKNIQTIVAELKKLGVS
jgi:tetratricopeptide (TPR) repeat protein